MSHKLTHLKLDNESSLGGKGKSTKKRKVKAGAMTKKRNLKSSLVTRSNQCLKRKRQPKYRQDVVLYKVKS